MPRSVKKWTARHDDQAIPARVKLRIWQRDGGICQGPCHRRLTPSDKVHFDHFVPLKDGGAHAESNIRVMCDGCHAVKTGLEATARAHVHAIQKHAYGIKTPSPRPVPGSKNSKWASRYNRETHRFEWVRRSELERSITEQEQ